MKILETGKTFRFNTRDVGVNPSLVKNLQRINDQERKFVIFCNVVVRLQRHLSTVIFNNNLAQVED